MLDLTIEQRVRRCYESALDTGLAEKAAIDAAMILWRVGRPEETLDCARQSVSHIIAQARIARRVGQLKDAGEVDS